MPADDGAVEQEIEGRVDALCTGVKITSQQNSATSFTFTATDASCDVGEDPEYRFMYVRDGVAGSVQVRGYSTDPQFTWDTSSLPPGRYAVYVYARSVNSGVSYQSYAGTHVLVGDTCGSITGITPSAPPPQLPGSTINFTGAATCSGDAQAEFRLWVRAPGAPAYTLESDWSNGDASNGYAKAWDTQGLSEGTYVIRVDARASGNASTLESSAYLTYTLGGSCDSVTLTPSPATRAVPGTLVSLAADATCTSATPEYRFSIRPTSDTVWTYLGDWGSSPVNWDTNDVEPQSYYVRVETRANTSSVTQTSKIIVYTVGHHCSAVSLVASPRAPQLQGTEIGLTATATCDAGATAEYRFLSRAPDSATLVELRGWDTSNAYNWLTTGLLGGRYSIYAQVRAGNSGAGAQAQAGVYYDLGPVCRLTGTGISPSAGSPGSQFTLDASASCAFSGTAEFRYSWRSQGATTWTVFRDWGPANATLDTTGQTSGNKEVLVETRAVGHVAPEHTATLSYSLGEPSNSFTQVVGGQGRTCALRDDGSVECWNLSGTPTGLTFSQIVAGLDHACGLRADTSEAVCWGSNRYGQLDAPSGVAFTQLSALWYHTCGVRADTGNVECWGFDGDGQSEAPEGVVFTQVSAAAFHSCGLLPDGSIQCWGKDNFGQISGAPSGLEFSQISAGYAYTCGVLADTSEVVCWGADSHGQVSGTPSGVAFSQIATGYQHMCGVRADTGALLCWGRNDWGQVGGVPSGVAFSQVAAGYVHTCGVRASDNAVRCWGNDTGASVSGPNSLSDP